MAVKQAQLERYITAVEASRRSYEDYTLQVAKMLREYVGAHYMASEGFTKAQPMNIIQVATNIYISQFASGTPRVNVVARNPALKATAKYLTIDLNCLSSEIKLKETLKKMIMASMLGTGFAKLGVAPGVGTDSMPFLQYVSHDDMILDLKAKSWESQFFMGNYYEIPLDVLQDDPDINQNELKKVVTQRWADKSSDTHIEDALNTDNNWEDPVAMVRLMDLFLPKEGCIVTVASDSKTALREIPWVGPEMGPYKRLAFYDVMDKVLPLSPMSIIFDLHIMLQEMWKKLHDQVLDEKTILAYRGTASTDVERIKAAKNATAVQIEDINSMKEIKFAGPSVDLYNMTSGVRETASWVAGNLDLQGGMGQSAETLGQEQILMATSNKKMDMLGSRVLDFLNDVFKDLAYYRMSDPNLHRIAFEEIPNTGVTVPIVIRQEEMHGSVTDYELSIEPYSLQFQTPMQRMAKINNIWQTFILPSMPFLQAQGITPKMNDVINTLSKYSDLPEFKDFFETAQNPEALKGIPTPNGKSSGPVAAPQNPRPDSNNMQIPNMSESQEE